MILLEKDTVICLEIIITIVQIYHLYDASSWMWHHHVAYSLPYTSPCDTGWGRQKGKNILS